MRSIRRPRYVAVLLLAALLLVASPPPAAGESAPTMVQDINTHNTGSDPRSFAAAGQLLFFSAYDPTYGRELWVTDGTAAATRLVRDLNPGSGSGLAESGAAPLPMGDAVYFLAADGASRAGLWRSDGTEVGTTLVRGLGAAGGGGMPFMASAGGLVFFVVGSYGRQELWRSDGTSQGTLLLARVPDGAAASGMLALGDDVYMLAGGAGDPLWRSDGTPGGTVRLGGPQYVSGIVAVGSTVYYGGDGQAGRSLWRSDGTPGGTAQVKAFAGRGFAPRALAAFEGKVLFAMTPYEGGSSVLWQSDGTEAGTSQLKSFAIASVDDDPRSLTVVGDTLFFMAAGSLWRSDGTPGGTVAVAPVPAPAGLHLPAALVRTGDELRFVAGDAATGYELWRSDGTPGGTGKLLEINPGPASAFSELGGWALYPFGDALFFGADDGAAGRELWRSGGTAAGTALLNDLSGSAGGSAAPERLTTLGDRVFFSADDGVHGRELWSDDLAGGGAALVKDINLGAAHAFQDTTIVLLNGRLLFAADDGAHGFELWRSDGTAAGTELVSDLQPGTSGAYPSHLTVLGPALYFTRGGPDGQLWRSDGTAAGTEPVLSFGDSRYVSRIEPFGTRLLVFVQQTTSVSGLFPLDLYVSDGTAAGTELLAQFGQADTAGGVAGVALVANLALFALPGELWATDGTEAGTRLLASVEASDLAAIDGRVIFAGDDGTHGREPWLSDGTAAGTRMIIDLELGPGGSQPANFTPLQGRVFVYSATTPAAGTELWVGDGTEIGNLLVRDLNPGAGSSLPHNLTPARILVAGEPMDGVLFTATDGVSGYELWQTAGNAAQTERVRDINPGASSSGPAQLTVRADDLFFSADDGAHGRELWRAKVADSSQRAYAPLVLR